MTETLIIPEKATKEERYKVLIPQLKSLVEGESDFIANAANVVAALKYSMDFFWVGVYIVKNDQLVLGPFQGPIACTRITKGKGVCGKAWELKKPIIVEDVEKFPGHIACSAESKSEIVIPAFTKNGDVFMVLDVDSDKLADFNDTDKIYLQQVIDIMEAKWHVL